MQPHLLHTWLHSLHQGLGLLTAQTMVFYTQALTLDTVQDGDQVTATDIPDMNPVCHTGDQGGQVLSWDWG